MTKKLNETKIEDIHLLYKFFRKIKRESRGKVLTNTIANLAKAFKLSETTIRNVIDGKIDGKVEAPKEKEKVKERIDNFDRQTIRLVIHGFYEENILPSAKMIRAKLKEKKNINISRNHLYKILLSIGFKYKSVKENRKVLIERNEVRASRAHYLRIIRDFRRRGYRVIYLDETWVNKNHCLTKSWLPDSDTNDIINLVTNKEMKLPKIPSGKGTRLIVLHAGCADTGFTEGCELVFIGKGH